MRTTIKVFLRTEEKKREALRLKEEKNSPPVIEPPTPVETPASVSVSVEEPAAPASNDSEATEEFKAEVPPVAQLDDATQKPDAADLEQPAEDQQDVPQPSIEVGVSPKFCSIQG